MERCTIRLKTGEARCTQLDGNVVVERLAAYEDTGLMPEEIAARRWIPVTERLPEDGQDVLCWYEYFRYGEYNAMFETYGIGYQYCGNWGGEVSHGTNARVLAWRPLPKAPEEGGKAGA